MNAAFAACNIYMILSTVYPSLKVPLLRYILLQSPAKSPTVTDFYLSKSFMLGSLFLYSGTYLRYLCYRTLGRYFTFELSFKDGHQLITSGPYSFVRHPSYLGMVMVLPGTIVALLFSPRTWWVESGMWYTWKGQVFGAYWCVTVMHTCWALLARVPKEDLMLKTQFKEQWISWARQTPYAVIPYVW